MIWYVATTSKTCTAYISNEFAIEHCKKEAKRLGYTKYGFVDKGNHKVLKGLNGGHWVNIAYLSQYESDAKPGDLHWLYFYNNAPTKDFKKETECTEYIIKQNATVFDKRCCRFSIKGTQHD